MAAFRVDNPSEWQRLDYRLLVNSPVALYFRLEVLNEDLAWLRGEGYEIDELECAGWRAEPEFHADVAARLAFPDYYGRNLNAFNDCMRDIEVPDVGGRAIVFRRFDLFAQRQPPVARAILEIMAFSSWRSLLFGRRLLTMIQSDDPRIHFQDLGVHPVTWNPREWLDKSRGVGPAGTNPRQRGREIF
jgi:RNAse (barnase) inhibitor barstar